MKIDKAELGFQIRLSKRLVELYDKRETELRKEIATLKLEISCLRAMYPYKIVPIRDEESL